MNAISAAYYNLSYQISFVVSRAACSVNVRQLSHSWLWEKILVSFCPISAASFHRPLSAAASTFSPTCGLIQRGQQHCISMVWESVIMCLMVYKSLNTVSHNQNTILQSAYCVFHVNFRTALLISRGQRQGGGLETLLFLSRIKQKINKKCQPEFHKSCLTSWIWAQGKTRYLQIPNMSLALA